MLHDGFLDDTLDSIEIQIANESIGLRRLEATTKNDEVQSADALVPLNIEYAAYELESAP